MTAAVTAAIFEAPSTGEVLTDIDNSPFSHLKDTRDYVPENLKSH